MRAEREIAGNGGPPARGTSAPKDAPRERAAEAGEARGGAEGEAGGQPRHLVIRNRRGLHARASAKFVQTAEAFDAQVTVEKDDMAVGGDSIMGLMMLAASLGSIIRVSAEGPQAGAALDAIAVLVATGFGEEA